MGLRRANIGVWVKSDRYIGLPRLAQAISRSVGMKEKVGETRRSESEEVIFRCHSHTLLLTCLGSLPFFIFAGMPAMISSVLLVHFYPPMLHISVPVSCLTELELYS